MSDSTPASPATNPHTEVRLWTARTENGLLEGEITLPDNPLAILIFPHTRYFRTDTNLQKRLALFHRLGFATLCCNIQSLQDLYQPPVLSDITRCTERLLDMLYTYRKTPFRPECPTILCARDELTAPAIRATTTRDLHIDLLLILDGLPDLAGKRFIDNLNSPTLFQHTPSEIGTRQAKKIRNELIATEVLHETSNWPNDFCISWVARNITKTTN